MRKFIVAVLATIANQVVLGFADGVFQVGNGAPANFNDGTVEVTVNSSNKGRKPTTAGETLGQFINRMATQYGTRSFTAYANGTKLDPSASATLNASAAQYRSIEITAKDARGTKVKDQRWLFTI